MSVVRVRHDRFTSRALRTLAAFGLTVRDVGLTKADHNRAASRAAAMAERVLRGLTPGGVVLLSGPSGAGKTTVLRAIESRAPEQGIAAVRVIEPSRLSRCPRRVVDVVATTLGGPDARGPERALTLLAACGLADARLAVMRACELSDGERARLAIAIGLAACEAHRGCDERVLLLIDEFAASLDAVTAAGLSRGLVRQLGVMRVSAVIATHREGLRTVLDPRQDIRLESRWLSAAHDPVEANS